MINFDLGAIMINNRKYLEIIPLSLRQLNNELLQLRIYYFIFKIEHPVPSNTWFEDLRQLYWWLEMFV